MLEISFPLTTTWADGDDTVRFMASELATLVMRLPTMARRTVALSALTTFPAMGFLARPLKVLSAMTIGPSVGFPLMVERKRP